MDDKKNNIVDFEQKKNEKYEKQIVNDNNEIAEMIIDACFADGQDDYDLAEQLLTGGISVTDEYEPLDRTLRSLYIERIAKKGYEKQANELRKRLSNMIDEGAEKMIRDSKKNSNTVKMMDREEYTNPEELHDSIPHDERMRIKKLVNDMVNARIDFSQMRNNEIYAVMKEAAKYVFYLSDPPMKKLVLNNERKTIEFTFKEKMPVFDQSMIGLSPFMIRFDEFSIYTNSKDKTVTMRFEFFH